MASHILNKGSAPALLWLVRQSDPGNPAKWVACHSRRTKRRSLLVEPAGKTSSTPDRKRRWQLRSARVWGTRKRLGWDSGSRTAAMVNAIKKVAATYQELGIFP